MENSLNLSFEGAEEIRSLVSEAGISGKGRARITLEVDVTEVTEEGLMAVPDTIESVDKIESDKDGGEEDAEYEEDSGEDTPGMVLVMSKRDKEKDAET